jgi:hypothetical protein
MSPHRWVLEARKPDADSEVQVARHTDEPIQDQPEKVEAQNSQVTEDTEGLAFRFPNAGTRSRRSSARRSRPA